MFVLSAGGHAQVVIDAMRSMGITPDGVTDPLVRGEVCGIEVIGTDDAIVQPSLLANGIGNKASHSDSGLKLRAAVFNKFRTAGCSFPKIVHAAAIVAPGSEIAEGAQIMARAVIQTGARIGMNTIINTGAIVEHHCAVGKNSHVAPGAVLCGRVNIGNEVHVGAGAIVLQGVVVGDFAVIAAGAVVTRNVRQSGFVGRGSPAPK